LWRLCLVNGSLDESRARAVVDRVIASGHSGGPAILSRWGRLLKADRARRTAQVESAAPLEADVRVTIERALARRYGPALATAFVVDPRLIGGMRVKVGSDVYDGSVRGRLEALETRF
jgi:F-type H+-transporting ATPase subunit delta